MCNAAELKDRSTDEEKSKQEVFSDSWDRVHVLVDAALQDKIDALSEEQPDAVPGSDLAAFTALRDNADQLKSVIADRVQMLYARPLLFSSMLFNM